MIPLGVLASANVPAAGGGIEFAFLQATATTSGSTNTHTFASQNLGTAGTDRTIFAAVTAQNPVTGVTIGGVTATKDVDHLGGSGLRATIWRAVVPTGATGDVVATISGGANLARCALGLWRASAAVTLTDSGTVATGLGVDVADGDFIVCARYGTGAITWSNVTERYDAVAEGLYYSGADLLATSVGTVTPSAIGGTYALCDAAYTPA